MGITKATRLRIDVRFPWIRLRDHETGGAAESCPGPTTPPRPTSNYSLYLTTTSLPRPLLGVLDFLPYRVLQESHHLKSSSWTSWYVYTRHCPISFPTKNKLARPKPSDIGMQARRDHRSPASRRQRTSKGYIA
jgi:hypothetical protein